MSGKLAGREPLTLRQGPEGSPNFCFGLYAADGRCVTFVQVDWDYAGLASSLGWSPCPDCGFTDGTVDCEHKTAGDMLAAAYDFLAARDGEAFDLDPNDFAGDTLDDA